MGLEKRGHAVCSFPRVIALLLLLQALDADALEERQRAVRDLIDRGEEALPFARQALESPDPEVRARAAEAVEAIRWNTLESGLEAFLAAEELPPDDFRRVTIDGLRHTRIYRTGRGGHSRLLALRADGEIRLSDVFGEGEQVFVVDVLRDVRARSGEDMLAIVELGLALLDAFGMEGWSAPGRLLAAWPAQLTESGVFQGGMLNRSPGMRAEFSPDGGLRSMDFWYRD